MPVTVCDTRVAIACGIRGRQILGLNMLLNQLVVLPLFALMFQPL